MRSSCLAAAAVVVVTLAACGGGSGGSAAPVAAPSGHTHDADAPSAAPAPPLREGERFVELVTAQPYAPEPPNGGTDEYRCLIVDPELTEAQFLTGVQYQPDDAAISHHTITFVVPPDDADVARTLDEGDPGEGWTCFGTGGLEGSTWADAWTPGAQETLFEEDLGYLVEPGSLLVLQVHYNLLGTGGEATAPDQPSVRLRLTEGTADTVPVDTLPLTAPIELPCLPEETGPLCDRDTAVADVHERFGSDSVEQHAWMQEQCGPPEPGNTQSCDYEIPVPLTVYGSRGHMHLLGRSITVELNPGTAAARPLLDVPAFDFDDQFLDVYTEPVQVQPGDVLRVTCSHDASLRQQLPQLQGLPPRYVVWGEGTSDEMCLGMLTVAGLPSA